LESSYLQVAKVKNLGSELLLLLTAAIWGLAFVAQRQGMAYLDPLLFNGIRFALGALIVGIFAVSRKAGLSKMPFPWLLGSVLFIAASLQQIGIVYTTAGNAGFITGLYVVFVPLLGIFRKQRISRTILIAIILSVIGLYFINANQTVTASVGNLIVLISAVFWAWHVQLIDRYTNEYDTLTVAFYQCSFCALASLGTGIGYQLWLNPYYLVSTQLYVSIKDAILPILYSGLLSVGIAYTLQVHAQKQVAPAPATIILCLEGVFALIGGWLLLKEPLTTFILIGAALLFTAMLLSIRSKFKSN
jgi:drug/metabolite transporter (DMT)-like permease